MRTKKLLTYALAGVGAYLLIRKWKGLADPIVDAAVERAIGPVVSHEELIRSGYTPPALPVPAETRWGFIPPLDPRKITPLDPGQFDPVTGEVTESPLNQMIKAGAAKAAGLAPSRPNVPTQTPAAAPLKRLPVPGAAETAIQTRVRLAMDSKATEADKRAKDLGLNRDRKFLEAMHQRGDMLNPANPTQFYDEPLGSGTGRRVSKPISTINYLSRHGSPGSADRYKQLYKESVSINQKLSQPGIGSQSRRLLQGKKHVIERNLKAANAKASRYTEIEREAAQVKARHAVERLEMETQGATAAGRYKLAEKQQIELQQKADEAARGPGILGPKTSAAMEAERSRRVEEHRKVKRMAEDRAKGTSRVEGKMSYEDLVREYEGRIARHRKFAGKAAKEAAKKAAKLRKKIKDQKKAAEDAARSRPVPPGAVSRPPRRSPLPPLAPAPAPAIDPRALPFETVPGILAVARKGGAGSPSLQPEGGDEYDYENQAKHDAGTSKVTAKEQAEFRAAGFRF